MKWRGILCALAALSMFVAAAPAGADGGTCEIGYADGGDDSPDADGDGLVCVDPVTGAVTDDAGQGGTVPGSRDRNQDFIVCARQTGSGMIITVDNNAANPDNANCPPAFQPSPLT